MDTRIIQVAIGLVLTFALTSLIVSTLNELWTSFRKSRADTLVLGICSLLGDNNVTVGRLRRRLMRGYKPSVFTQNLLAQPLLESQVLGGARGSNGPSYLPPDIFIAALIAYLSTLYAQGKRPDTPQQWVNTLTAGIALPNAVAAGAGPNPSLVQTLVTLSDGADTDWQAYEQRLCAWYDSVMTRSGGWYRRDTQLRLAVVGFIVAVTLNVNPLIIGPRLWNDPALSAAVTAVAVEASKAYSAAASASAPSPASGASTPASDVATMAALRALLASAASAPRAASSAADSKRQPPPGSDLPQSLEVDRALASFKDSVDDAIAPNRAHVGFDILRRVIDVQERLSDLEEQVQRRRSVAPSNFPLRVFDGSIEIESHIAALHQAFDETADRAREGGPRNGQGPGHADIRQQLARLDGALRRERNALLPANAGDRDALTQRACGVVGSDAAFELCRRLDGIQSLTGVGLPIGWSWANWPNCDGACQARHSRPRPGKTGTSTVFDTYAQKLGPSSTASAAELKGDFLEARRKFDQSRDGVDERPVGPRLLGADEVSGYLEAITGWLIIAVAVTFGGPFWFDLLTQFVKLRGSGIGSSGGTDSKDKSSGPPASGASVLTPASPPTGGAQAPSPAENGAVNETERALGSAQIIRIQNALGMSGTDATGRLDSATRQKIAAFQEANNLNGTGELTAQNIATLVPPPAPPQVAPAPVAAALRSRTPVRADGTITVLTDTEVRTLYGNIGTVPDRTDPNLVEIRTFGLPGQAQLTLADFKHPVLEKLGAQGGSLKIHSKALKHFFAAFDAVQSAGLADLVISCAGTFCPRHIGHDLTKPLSRHTWGIAIDLNAEQNGFGNPPASKGSRGSVIELVPIFEKFGFAWGGRFTTGQDGMHFELALREPDQAPTA